MSKPKPIRSAIIGAGMVGSVHAHAVHRAGGRYQDCVNAFVGDVYDAIRTGEHPDGLPVFADGLRAAEIHAAVAASVTGGTWVDVAEDHATALPRSPSGARR